jgi:hypothetical protein
LCYQSFFPQFWDCFFQNIQFSYSIRKQIIWGNKYIKYKGKCLVKVNWIRSGIIFINDILNEYGHISEYKIIAKLRKKQNWISDLNILKKAIPKLWKETLITQDSMKTQVIAKNVC